MLIDIKYYLQDEFQLDLVPIQSGVYFNLYEENAEFFKETWDFRTYNQTQLYIQAGFPLARSDFYSNYFSENAKAFAIVEQRNVNGEIIRVVTDSSHEGCLGLVFERHFEYKRISSGLEVEEVEVVEEVKEDIPAIVEVAILETTDDILYGIDPYDLRRITLFHGLIAFASSATASDLQKAMEMLNTPLLPGRNHYQLIFAAALIEGLNPNQNLGPRQVLKFWSDDKEENYEDSFFNQFMKLVDSGVTPTHVEGHAVLHGTNIFDKWKALEIFFEFQAYDFQDVEFGEHGWQATDPLEPRKNQILDELSLLRPLDFEEALERFVSY